MDADIFLFIFLFKIKTPILLFSERMCLNFYLVLRSSDLISRIKPFRHEVGRGAGNLHAILEYISGVLSSLSFNSI